MSPTIYREGPYRFYFNSNEETRIHVHVESPSGKAKFWLEPLVALSEFRGMKSHELTDIQKIIESRKEEFSNAWRKHFNPGSNN